MGGDFHTVLGVEDRLNGQPVSEAEIRDFAECMKHNELTELRYIGDSYTWCNNQEHDSRIFYKIDRCMANVNWFTHYGSACVEILDKSVSDHCPLLVDLRNDGGGRSFQILECFSFS